MGFNSGFKGLSKKRKKENFETLRWRLSAACRMMAFPMPYHATWRWKHSAGSSKALPKTDVKANCRLGWVILPVYLLFFFF